MPVPPPPGRPPAPPPPGPNRKPNIPQAVERRHAKGTKEYIEEQEARERQERREWLLGILKSSVKYIVVGVATAGLSSSSPKKDGPLNIPQAGISRNAEPDISKYLPLIKQISALDNPTAAKLCRFTDEWYQNVKPEMLTLFSYLNTKSLASNDNLKKLVLESIALGQIWNDYRLKQGLLFRAATNEAGSNPEEFIPTYVKKLQTDTKPGFLSACGSHFNELFKEILEKHGGKTDFIEQMVINLIKAVMVVVDDEEKNNNGKETEQTKQIRNTLTVLLGEAVKPTRGKVKKNKF